MAQEEQKSNSPQGKDDRIQHFKTNSLLRATIRKGKGVTAAQLPQKVGNKNKIFYNSDSAFVTWHKNREIDEIIDYLQHPRRKARPPKLLTNSDDPESINWVVISKSLLPGYLLDFSWANGTYDIIGRHPIVVDRNNEDDEQYFDGMCV